MQRGDAFMVDKNVEITVPKYGHILKWIREEKKYKREQIAERAGISIRYLTAIENEENQPGYRVLYKLVHSLGISADQIFYQNESEDDDANEMKRLYMECNERDKALIRALINTTSSNYINVFLKQSVT